MSQLVQLELRLFGPRKRQTININGHPFVRGVYLLAQSSDHIGPCLRVFSFYGAFARGTPEYDEALEIETSEELAEALANGASEVHEEAQQGATDEVRSDVRQNGEGLASQDAVESVGSAETETGSTGIDTSGNGHEHTGIPKFEETLNRREPTEPSSSVNEIVKTAVLKLDPEEDTHWVMKGAHKGKPKLSAVEEAYGKAGLTRGDLEMAVPGWDRTKAWDAALAAA